MRPPVARRAALVLLLAGVALQPGCAEPERIALAQPPIEVRLHLEREDGRSAERFVAGETVGLVLTVRNPGETPWRLGLSTAQSHDFAIGTSDGQELWRWSADRRFAQRLGELALEPGEERRFRTHWRPAHAALPPGRYRAAGWIGGRSRGPGAELEFRVAARD